MSNEKLTEADEKFVHLVYEHVVAAYEELMAACFEAFKFASEESDPRFHTFIEEIKPVADLIENFAQDQLDKIPGLISREEAAEQVTKLLEHTALLDGLPSNSYITEKLTLQ